MSPEQLQQCRVPEIGATAYYVSEFISDAEEARLVTEARGAGSGPRWTQLRGRRAAQWGGLPGVTREPLPRWAQALANQVAHVVSLQPDHLLVNEYAPGEGIMAHCDGARFQPTVCTVSCGGPTVLRLWQRARPVGALLLEPRSLLVLTDSLYSQHEHSIEPLTHDLLGPELCNLSLCAAELRALPNGHTLPRALRTSFTLRRVARRTRESRDQPPAAAITAATV